MRNKTLASGVVSIILGAIIGFLLGWFAVYLVAIVSYFADCMSRSIIITTLITFAAVAAAIYGIYRLSKLMSKNNVLPLIAVVASGTVLSAMIVISAIEVCSRASNDKTQA